MSIIQLHNGIFDLDNPGEYVDNITIEDVAHALVHINRFQGRLKRQVSVAEHSCVQCLYVLLTRPVGYLRYTDALAALLHDSAEMLIGDINGVFKDSYPEVSDKENAIQRELFHHFGLSGIDYNTVLLQHVDNKATICEGYLYCSGPYWKESWATLSSFDRVLLKELYYSSSAHKALSDLRTDILEELVHVLDVPPTIKGNAWDNVYCILYYWLRRRLNDYSK